MATPTLAASVIARPLVSLGRAVCGDLPSALRREWLVTNGSGGYASATLAGVCTRRYHGLLVAALTPPVGRIVLVGGLVEWAAYDGQRYPLSAHEYGGGTIDPHGYLHLQSFALEGMLPVWTFALGDALLERRVWMVYGANATYAMYRLLRGTRAVDLDVTPLVTYRDFHTLSHAGDLPHLAVETQPRGAVVRAFERAQPLRLLADRGEFSAGGDWYWNFYHREEAARGLDASADLYAPGHFAVTLEPGSACTLLLSADGTVELNAERALADALERQAQVLRRAGAEQAAPVVRQLTLAADQFVVRRRPVDDSAPTPAGSELPAAGSPGTTVIAGYHWFSDWGRDTMIALPGLTLATGRAEDAARILRTFARYVADGLIPNNFPDRAGVDPGYNTADAALWYVLAVRAYHEATGDDVLADELLPVLRDIIDHHVRGTRVGIGADAADGLLHAGAPGLQLTWMDAKVGDWVVTPRIGKPVEINALWYNALCTLAAFPRPRGDGAAKEYEELAARVRASFRARFVVPGQGHLADVVDGPDGDDLTCRPNQIFAVSLPVPLLDGADAAAVVEAVGRALLTTYGLRSLSPADRNYQGTYGGDPRQRDGAYHQGTAWTWLLGAYAEAHYRVYRDTDGALALLRPLEQHLSDGGLGTISELVEGDPPHLPRGCIAQAWSVAEALRVWRALSRQYHASPALHVFGARL